MLYRETFRSFLCLFGAALLPVPIVQAEAPVTIDTSIMSPPGLGTAGASFAKREFTDRGGVRANVHLLHRPRWGTLDGGRSTRLKRSTTGSRTPSPNSGAQLTFDGPICKPAEPRPNVGPRRSAKDNSVRQSSTQFAALPLPPVVKRDCR